VINKLLVDECLSPRLVSIAADYGYHATHVNYIGKSSVADWQIVKSIEAGDYIFATNNARDFIRLYSRMHIHNDLIVIFPSVERDIQVFLFEKVLRHIDSFPDIINKCIAIDIEGAITVTDLHA
jgi:predicted nuclease of predicted toxin-antitoxin system